MFTVHRVSIHITVYILHVQSAQCKVRIGLWKNWGPVYENYLVGRFYGHSHCSLNIGSKLHHDKILSHNAKLWQANTYVLKHLERKRFTKFIFQNFIFFIFLFGSILFNSMIWTVHRWDFVFVFVFCVIKKKPVHNFLCVQTWIIAFF